MNTKEKKAFSFVARAKSFTHACRGIGILIRTTHNAWVHIALALVALILGCYFCISTGEWLALILSIGFVFAAEAFNTAIEIDIDLTSPEYHPFARDTKDVAAGAVLIAALTALAIGFVIFVPKILLAFSY